MTDSMMFEGALLADELLRLETIDQQWAELSERLGGLPEFPKRHGKGNVAIPWTDELKALVYERYRRDFETIGYER
jgi:hypothetical protein